MTVEPARADTSASDPLPWHWQELDWASMRPGGGHDELLVALIAAASFVESATAVYTRNLVGHFHDRPEVRDWLDAHWRDEELQHGAALREFTQRAWPDFDWPAAYATFHADYTRRCTPDDLNPDPQLELVARCVVETGTATLYRSFHELALAHDEPLLADLTRRIMRDEVSHFRHFHGFFRRVAEPQRRSRLARLRVIAARATEVRDDDAACALRHVHAHRFARRAGDTGFDALRARGASVLRSRYPFAMVVRMGLKPLDLPARVGMAIERPAAWMLARLMR
ncbi:ferritin-like domain-containing protein [Derxia gummosa]|uniref:Ferritin-like domain-containing protein n=1 Tax=Derxia gummosa DSM 723 TaxID=1121388 RepID=A0A8B6X3J5_9BURK|nr:ferritin-like domain-containing protein [Derxia gummosa]